MRQPRTSQSAIVAAGIVICLWCVASSALAQSGRLMGRIMDKSGNPVSGATLYITCASSTQAAVSNAQGYYTFLSVPSESYKIKAYKRGYEAWLSNVSVGANAITRIDVKLEKGGSSPVAALVADEKKNSATAVKKTIPIVRKKESVEVVANAAANNEGIAAELKTEGEDEKGAQELINLTDENLKADDIEQIATLISPTEIVGGIEAVYQQIKYPELALKAGAEGKSVAQVFIDKDGNLLKVNFLKNINPILDAEVMRVLTEETKFKPAQITGGKTVAGTIVIPFNFKIRK